MDNFSPGAGDHENFEADEWQQFANEHEALIDTASAQVAEKQNQTIVLSLNYPQAYMVAMACKVSQAWLPEDADFAIQNLENLANHITGYFADMPAVLDMFEAQQVLRFAKLDS